MPQSFALRVDPTGILPAARVDAGARLALLVWLAVGVQGALDALALHLRIALKALRAETHGAMVGGAAFGCGGASAGGTGIDALTGDTGSG